MGFRTASQDAHGPPTGETRRKVAVSSRFRSLFHACDARSVAGVGVTSSQMTVHALRLCTDSAVASGVRDVVGLRIPPQVAYPVVCPVPVVVAGVQSSRSGTDEYLQHQMVNVPRVALAVAPKFDHRVPVSSRRSFQLPITSTDSTVVADLVTLEPRNGLPYLHEQRV